MNTPVTARTPNPIAAAGTVVLTLVFGFGIQLLLPGETGSLVALALLLGLVIWTAWRKGTGLSEIGLNRPASWLKTLMLGVAWAVFIFLLFRLFLQPLLETITGVERDLSRFDYLKGDETALANTLIMLWVSAALMEEVLFRGFLVTQVAEIFRNTRAGWVTGIIGSAVIFGLVHAYQGLSGVLLTGLAGVLFGFIFVFHGRNLWVAVLAHGFTDSSAAFMVYLDIYERVTSLVWQAST